jgi:hypothetical protein
MDVTSVQHAVKRPLTASASHPHGLVTAEAFLQLAIPLAFQRFLERYHFKVWFHNESLN